MAINYTYLFDNRLRGLVGAINDHIAFYTDISTYEADLDSKFNTAGSHNLLGSVYTAIDNANAANLQSIGSLLNVVDLVITDRTNVLNELPELTSSDSQSTLAALRADMVQNSKSVAASAVTVGSVTAVKTNTNAGTVKTSTELDGVSNPAYYAQANRAYAGTTTQLSLTSDTLKVTCLTDSETDRVTIGNEQFVITGKPQAPSLFSHLSKGSGGSTNITCAQGDSVVSYLSFDAWVSNEPTGWTNVSGTGGTDYEEETTVVAHSGSSLQINGNMEIKLPVWSSVDTLTNYLIGFLISSDGSVTGATLNIFLEGTGFTTEGTGEEISMDATALNAQTSLDIESFTTVLPNELPTDLALHIEVTGMSAGTIYVDFGFFHKMAYHDGIAIGVVSGRETFIRGDEFTFTVTNDDAGEYQAFFRDAYGVQLPTSGSPSQAY